MLALSQRLDKALNPILVKEVLQGLRGTGLVVSAFATLAFGLLTYFGIAVSDAPSGRALFGVIYMCVWGVTGLVIPVGIGRELRRELEDGTFGLLTLTGLSAERNLRGRIQAGALQLALGYALISPFAVVAGVLGDVAFETIGVGLWLSFWAGITLVAAAVLLNSLAALQPRILRGMVAGQLLTYPVAAIPLAAMIFAASRAAAGCSALSWSLWTPLVALTIVDYAVVNAARAVTVSARPSRRDKISVASLWGLLLVPLTVPELFGNIGRDAREMLVCAALAVTTTAGLVWLSQTVRLHRWPARLHYIENTTLIAIGWLAPLGVLHARDDSTTLLLGAAAVHALWVLGGGLFLTRPLRWVWPKLGASPWLFPSLVLVLGVGSLMGNAVAQVVNLPADALLSVVLVPVRAVNSHPFELVFFGSVAAPVGWVLGWLGLPKTRAD